MKLTEGGGDDVYLWRRVLWGLKLITQMPSEQSFPTKQCGCGRWGRSFVTRDTVTVTFFILSIGPWSYLEKTGKGYYAKEDCLHNDVIFWSKLPYMETELFKVENLCSVYLLCGTSLLHTTRWSNTSHRGTFFFFVPQRSTDQHHSLKPKQGQPPLGLG